MNAAKVLEDLKRRFPNQSIIKQWNFIKQYEVICCTLLQL